MADKTALANKAAAAAEHATRLDASLIQLMGMSFVLGSLFTVFILIVLDFMKRDRGIDK